jgi:hypothetical protein
MSFISDLPFTTENTTNGEVNLVNLILNCQNQALQGEAFFPENTICVEQLQDRQEYLQAIGNNNLRTTIFPCPSISGKLIAERRKAEVLSYTSNQNKLTYSERYAKLANAISVSGRACITDIPYLSSQIPLNNHNSSVQATNSQPYPALKESYTETVFTSVINQNANPVSKIVFINPASLNNTYDLTSPLAVRVSGTVLSTTDTRTIQISVQSVNLEIYNTGVGDLQYTYPMNIDDLKTATLTVNSTGSFTGQIYLGNVDLDGFQLTSCAQYNYSFVFNPMVNITQFTSGGGAPSNPISLNTYTISNNDDSATSLLTQNNCSFDKTPPLYIPYSFSLS